MILAIDVYYIENTAKSVGVLFEWEDEQAREVIIDTFEGVSDYEPGAFFKRELPCITSLLQKIPLEKIDLIVVDGYVYVDDALKYGLGGYVWEYLDPKIPVIGVAKNSFHANKNTVFPLYRGESKKPLYISAIGMDVMDAVSCIQKMKGNYRFPTILKSLDTMTKE